MHKVYMNSSDHDVHVAYISHISHITSFSLALCVLEKEQEEQPNGRCCAQDHDGPPGTVRIVRRGEHARVDDRPLLVVTRARGSLYSSAIVGTAMEKR